MANKMTQKDYFNEIIAVVSEVGRDDLVKFCEDRIDKLNRKSTNKKPTKVQVANETLKATLVEVLSDLDTPSTVSAILTDPRIEVGTSNQKVSALLKQLREEGAVVRTEDKGKALYSVADVATED
jgi:DNA replication initiation complex subunit (GINS family)